MLGNTQNLKDRFSTLKSDRRLPALFIGHGSPRNGIQDNHFSKTWAQLGRDIPQPAAVLVVSAHWLTRGTFITAMGQPRTIHDFGGFPQELFEVQYPVPGFPELVSFTAQQVKSTKIEPDHEWGLDHGAWTVLRYMYPEAEIPVLQLSIDYYQSPEHHYQLGKEWDDLRKKAC